MLEINASTEYLVKLLEKTRSQEEALDMSSKLAADIDDALEQYMRIRKSWLQDDANKLKYFHEVVFGSCSSLYECVDRAEVAEMLKKAGSYRKLGEQQLGIEDIFSDRMLGGIAEGRPEDHTSAVDEFKEFDAGIRERLKLFLREIEESDPRTEEEAEAHESHDNPNLNPSCRFCWKDR